MWTLTLMTPIPQKLTMSPLPGLKDSVAAQSRFCLPLTMHAGQAGGQTGLLLLLLLLLLFLLLLLLLLLSLLLLLLLLLMLLLLLLLLHILGKHQHSLRPQQQLGRICLHLLGPRH